MANTRQPQAPRHMALSLERKQRWAKDSYGVFARIARILGFSRCFVTQCYWGAKRNPAINRALDRAIFGNSSARRKPAA